MTRLYERASDGYPVGSDTILRNAYGQIPDTALFQMHNSYAYAEPTTVHGWGWSTTFGRWSALVTFADGWHGWTYPKTY